MTAPFALPSRPSARDQIRALARDNATVAAFIGLVDGNALPYVDGLEALVLGLVEANAALLDDLIKAVRGETRVRFMPGAVSLPDRDDDGACLICSLVECAGHDGGAT